MDVLESPTAQAHRYDLASCTVHRRIYDVQVLLAEDRVLINHYGLDSHHVVVIHLAADDLNQVFVGLPLDVSKSHFVHLVDYSLIMRLQHLRTILPVCFVAVVLLRVVRCGYVHTALALQVTDSKTYLRCRTQALEQIYLDSVGREDVCHGLGEQTSVVTAVMTYHYCYATVLYVLESTFLLHFEHVIRITLCRHSNNVLVHTVRTGAHDTAQTAGTELQSAIESIDKLGFVLGFHHCFHLCAGLRVKRFTSPNLGRLHNFFQFFVHDTCDLISYLL